jgi:hypothetical protein
MIDQLNALLAQLATVESAATALANDQSTAYIATLKAGCTEAQRLAAHPAKEVAVLANIQQAKRQLQSRIKALTPPPVAPGKLPANAPK